MKSRSFAQAVACVATGFGLSSFAATTYYWTGAVDVGQAKCEFFTAGNWAKADGTVATAAPVKGDTVVFTNDTALTLSANANLPSYCWRFEGRGDVLGPGQTEGSKKTYAMEAGSSAVANGGGTYKLDYSVSLGMDMGDFVVDVAEGSTMGLSTYGTTTMYSGSRLVKRGPGTERHDRLFPNSGSGVRLEEGYLSLNRGGNTNNTGATVVFEIVGPAAKKLGCDEGTLVIPHYVETEDALGTLSFVISNGNHRSILMKGTATVTRCSADIYNEREGLTHQLVWNPDGATTLDLVGRVHDQVSGKLYAKSGKMRFAEGAGIRRLKELRVGAGAEVEVTRSANDEFREMALAVEEGGVLRIDGASEASSYNQNAVASDFYPTNSITWNGLIDLCGKRRLYMNRSWNATGSFSCGAAAGLRLSGSDVHRILTYSVGDITLSNYVETAEAEMTGDFACYTSSDDHLILRGTEDTRFTADIYNLAGGLYQLVWDPVDATKTLTVAKRTFAKSHTAFRVKKGTMRFAEGAGIVSASEVAVDAGATLSFAADAGKAFLRTTFALADDTAKVDVAAGTAILVKEVTVGGISIPVGSHTKATAAWMTGDGTVVVVPVSESASTYRIWTGGGATAALDDPANWGGELPDLSTGSLVATFPAGVKTVTVPATGAYLLRGIVAEDPAFRLEGSATSLLLVGSDGIALPDRADQAVVEISCPLFLTKAQVWSIGTNSVLRLAETARLTSSVFGIVVTQRGLKGVVEYRSSNDDLVGDFKLEEGTARVYADNAFGGAARKLEQAGRALVELHGCALDCAIHLGGVNQETVLSSVEGVNVLNGLVTVDDPNVGTFSCFSASQLHFRGGVTFTGTNNGASWSPISGFRLWIGENPVSITKTMLGISDSSAGSLTTELHLDVADNSFPRGLILRYNKTKGNVLSTGVPYALKLDGGGVSFAEDATKSSWDLCGCDQHANVFFSRCVGAKVTSEAPATLHLVDDALNYVKPTERDNNNMKWSIQGTASQVDRTTFAGAASFSKDGALTHYLMGESTSTGGVYVTKGELVFTKASSSPVTLPQTTAITGPEANGYTFTPLAGSWRTASEAVVTGGRLTLEHGQVFGKATDVKVAGDGVIDLAAGVVQKCHALTIGGTTYEAGTWGGPESNAEHKDAHFAGSGKLVVVGDGLGLVILVK